MIYVQENTKRKPSAIHQVLVTLEKLKASMVKSFVNKPGKLNHTITLKVEVILSKNFLFVNQPLWLVVFSKHIYKNIFDRLEVRLLNAPKSTLKTEYRSEHRAESPYIF